MSIVKYDPMRGFDSLAKRMNSFFNNIEPRVGFETGDFLPRVDISENDQKLMITAEMPGISKEDFKVTVDDDRILVIKGTKKRENVEKSEQGGMTYHRLERTCGNFVRSFALPDYVNTESINAKFENGVLNISFDKAAPVQPKEIEISVS